MNVSLAGFAKATPTAAVDMLGVRQRRLSLLRRDTDEASRLADAARVEQVRALERLGRAPQGSEEWRNAYEAYEAAVEYPERYHCPLAEHIFDRDLPVLNTELSTLDQQPFTITSFTSSHGQLYKTVTNMQVSETDHQIALQHIIIVMVQQRNGNRLQQILFGNITW
ncbi:hypothetical protein HYFRA_00012493 [Hymenoscyphus fraxineus]|uniref:Uncharacterized protein n=1 Tax=Hymenoscyphus fraxineus TaxID=746836 RepID=A0A9N9L2K3_9HELO|nr:hypothetical protein HYFRA_00012493 [Hymenoscyphus fraxineus]